MPFFSPNNETEVKTWTKLVNRVFVDSSGKKETFQMGKYTKICSSHFEYGRPVEAAPSPTLFLKGYDKDAKVGVKRKAPKNGKEPLVRKKILRKEPTSETKKITTRQRAAGRNTIRSKASLYFSTVTKQS